MKTRRDLAALLRPLDELGAKSGNLFPVHIPLTTARGEPALLPRYYFAGPGTQASFIRVGLFAGIHGDEDAGVYAALRFLDEITREPEKVRGYEFFVYPVCNPTGFADGTRWSRSGLDLNREFWRGTGEIEVQLLERQLENLLFDGILALHADDTSEGLYGFVKGHALTRHVLEPALERAEKVLPRNYDKSIDNFAAQAGVIVEGYRGILSAPPHQHPKPFEIVFETPQLAPLDRQIEASLLAIQEILDRFRVLISEAQNI
ncbi:MAG TPA: succinylglutamate desuccinylase/aspartoacylase family protein [Chthoniobacterales bacterium]